MTINCVPNDSLFGLFYASHVLLAIFPLRKPSRSRNNEEKSMCSPIYKRLNYPSGEMPPYTFSLPQNLPFEETSVLLQSLLGEPIAQLIFSDGLTRATHHPSISISSHRQLSSAKTKRRMVGCCRSNKNICQQTVTSLSSFDNTITTDRCQCDF
jgi:hypothetical protein